MEQQQDLQQAQQGMQPMLGPDPTDLSGSYYQPENDLTGGLPINLDSLRDGPPGSKPFYPYSTLIRWVAIAIFSLHLVHASCLLFPLLPSELTLSSLISYAIKGSPNQKLLLEDIYYAIESRVCWAIVFATCGGF